MTLRRRATCRRLTASTWHTTAIEARSDHRPAEQPPADRGVVDVEFRPEVAVDRARFGWPLLLASATAVFVVHLYAVLDASGPIVFEDEIGYLMTARYFAGQTNGVSLGPMGTYSLGWSLPLTPLALLLEDPRRFYQATLLLGVACSVATLLPLRWLGRELLGLRGGLETLAPAVVLVMPGVALMSGYAYAEGWYGLVYSTAAVLAVRWTRSPTIVDGAALAALSSLAFHSHGRGIAVVITTGIVFAAALLRRERRTSAGLGLVTLVITFWIGSVAQSNVQGAIYVVAFDRAPEVFSRIFDSPMPFRIASVSGQLFYATVTTLGLVGIGVFVALRRAIGDVRGRTLDAASWIALSCGGTLLISALPFARGFSSLARVDYYGYGRYIDGVNPVLALFGLAALLGAATRRERVTLVAIPALLGTATAGLMISIVGWESLSGKPIAALSVAGLAPWIEPPFDRYPVVMPLIAMFAALTGWVALSGWRLPLALTFVAFASLSVHGEQSTMRVLDGPWQDFITLEDDLGRIDPPELWIDDRADHLYARNGYQYALPDVPIRFYNGPTAPDEADLVVTTRNWADGEAQGARRVSTEIRIDQALWVLPGPLADELEKSGFLEVPTDVPLPAEAAIGRLDSSVERVDIRSGDRVAVDLDITHAGTAAPWRSLRTLADPVGAVRVWIRWETSEGVWLKSELRELPENMLPGDSLTMDIGLEPPPADGSTTRLRFSLLNEGFSELPDTEFVIPVIS